VRESAVKFAARSVVWSRRQHNDLISAITVHTINNNIFASKRLTH
jgi:hypothetical protein